MHVMQYEYYYCHPIDSWPVVMHAILCPTPKVNTALDLPAWPMSVMIVLVKLVGCILLISVCCCDVAQSQSQSESCTNRSIEYADCISKAGLSVSKTTS